MSENMLIMKLGGACLTKKDSFETLDNDGINACAQHVAQAFASRERVVVIHGLPAAHTALAQHNSLPSCSLTLRLAQHNSLPCCSHTLFCVQHSTTLCPLVHSRRLAPVAPPRGCHLFSLSFLWPFLLANPSTRRTPFDHTSGAGSFGHFHAKEYNLTTGGGWLAGGAASARARKGMVLCRASVRRLNHAVVSALHEVDVPAIEVDLYPFLQAKVMDPPFLVLKGSACCLP